MVNYCQIAILTLVTIFPIETIFSLPPQIKSVNEFMKSNDLKRTGDLISGSINNRGVFQICFTRIENKRFFPLKYKSFNSDGSVKVNEKTLLSCGSISRFSNYRCMSDKEGNLHVTFLDQRKGYKYSYILVDSLGTVLKEVELGDLITIADMNFLSDGSIIINGIKMGVNIPDLFEIFYIIHRDLKDYQIIEIKSPTTTQDTPNYGTSLYPVNDSLVLLLTTRYNYDTGDWLALITYVNLLRKKIERFQKIPVRNIASAFYGGFDKDINPGLHSFIYLGDTLVYWNRMPKNGPMTKEDNFDIPSTDSIFVILLDKEGKLLTKDPPIYRTIKLGILDNLDSKSVLCWSNGYPYFRAVRKNGYSPFGILSFRNFPEIILDIEKWNDAGK